MYNTDPGVYEPECDWNEEQGAYPDTQQFLIDTFKNMQDVGQQQEPQAGAAAAEPQDGVAADPALPLKGDYQGLGGPQTVPLYTPSAFERPAQPAKDNSILTEIFMEPTTDQMQAYNRVILRGKVAQNKNRLKWTIFFHYIMVFVIISKLMPDILDKVDVFILEVEELFVPKPLLWEWLWILSVPVTFFGLSACKKSNLIAIRRFMLGSLLFSLLPIFIGMVVHAPQAYSFLVEEEEEEEGVEAEPADEIIMWQGYPYAVLWYAFFFLALQVHCYELYFANCLMKAWMPDIKKTQ